MIVLTKIIVILIALFIFWIGTAIVRQKMIFDHHGSFEKEHMNQDRIDEAAITSLFKDLPGGVLILAVEVFAGIGFIASCIWLFARII